MKKRVIITLLIVLIIILSIIFSIKFFNKKSNNDNVLNSITEKFFVDKIHYYSNAKFKNNTENYQSPEWNLNIGEYTDIAIYIDRILEANDLNYIKRLYIDNIKIDNSNKRKLYAILFKSN